jgi:hypothetical protein
MNRYICETCKHPDENPNKCPCPLNDLKLEREIIEVGELCGLGCHSDFQNQRENYQITPVELKIIEGAREINTLDGDRDFKSAINNIKKRKEREELRGEQ